MFGFFSVIGFPFGYLNFKHIHAERLSDPVVCPFRRLPQLRADKVPHLVAAPVSLQRVGLAGQGSFLHLAQTRADHDGIVVDAKLPACADTVMSVENLPFSSTSTATMTPRSAMSALSAANCSGGRSGNT